MFKVGKYVSLSWDKSKIRWFSIILLLLVTAFILVHFFGIPFGKTIARFQFNRYLEHRYREQKVHINKIYYNFKNGVYRAKVVIDSGNNYMNYYWDENAISESNFTEEYESVFQKEIDKLIKDSDLNININYITIFPKIDIMQDFGDKELKTKDSIVISLKQANGENVINDKEFVDLAYSLLEGINKQYIIDFIIIRYKNDAGETLYQLRLNKQQTRLDKSEAIKLIK